MNCRVDCLAVLFLVSFALVTASDSSASEETRTILGAWRGQGSATTKINLGEIRVPKFEPEKPKYAIVSPTGDMLTEAIWDETRFISEGLCAVRKDKKFGFVDSNGRMQIEPQFDNATEFSEGLAAVAIADKWGFIDRTGKFVIKPKFCQVENFSDGLACVEKDSWMNARGGCPSFGYIDKSGRLVIPPKFQGFDSFHSGIANVYDGTTGDATYINKKGKVIFRRPGGQEFCNGFASFISDGMYGFIDSAGRVITNDELFSWVKNFSEGLAAIRSRNEKKCGYIGEMGKYILPPIYEMAESFSEGLAAVVQDGKWKYIDRNGKTAIDLGADRESAWPQEFHDGLAIIYNRSENTSQIIDQSGKIVAKFRPPLKVVSAVVEDKMIIVVKENKVLKPPEKPVLIIPPTCE